MPRSGENLTRENKNNRLAYILLRRWRNHENCGGDESRRSAIESLPSACGLTLRVAAASEIASPLRVSSPAADTKRLRRHEMTRKNGV